MKLDVLRKATAVAALGLVLAGCGGSGGGGESSPSSLQVSGTAATGAALAGASVEVKCAAGNGVTTTSSAGAYSVSMTGASLPCIVRATGTSAGGASVTLHSVVETGTGGTGNTAAVANVTPVTEMIVAQLLQTAPSEGFGSFDPQRVTQQALSTATTAIVDALKAAGIDLGAIDPLKASLVPASGSTTGNAYDVLLDKLGETVTPEALPVLVAQIAAAAASDAPAGLGDAMVAVSGGTLEGCPAAISGKYRTMDYLGSTVVREVDFKKARFMSGNGVDSYAITVDPARPCTFKAAGTIGGTTSEFEVAIGPSGIGTYRARVTAPALSPGVTGWIFLVQAHEAATLAGDWTSLQSGQWEAEPFRHVLGKFTFGADAKVAVCDYDGGGTCVPDSEANLSFAARPDGGFDLSDTGVAVARVYAYRIPDGSVTLFGTTNPMGATGPTIEQTVIVAKRPGLQPMRELGSVLRTSESTTTVNNGSYSTGATLVQDGTEVIAVDSSTSSYTRRRVSDGRIDVWTVNKPIAGVGYRDVVNGQAVPPVLFFAVPGASVALNGPGNALHFYNISVVRP